MNKLFSESSKVWNWIVQSSANPQQVSLTVRGVLVGVIPFLMQFLPMFGIHVSPDFNNIPDYVEAIVYYGLTIVASVMTAYGFFRKVFNAFVPPATQ